MACFHTSALAPSVSLQADLRPSARIHVHLLIASQCAKNQSHRCTSYASRSSVNVRDSCYCDRFEVRDTAGGASTAFPFGWPLVPPGSLVRDPPWSDCPKLQTPSALDHVGQIIDSSTNHRKPVRTIHLSRPVTHARGFNRTFSPTTWNVGPVSPSPCIPLVSHIAGLSPLFSQSGRGISRLCPLAVSSSFVTFKVAAPAYPPGHPSFQSCCCFSSQTRLRIVCHIQAHARESYAALYSTLQTADLNCASLTHRIEPT